MRDQMLPCIIKITVADPGEAADVLDHLESLGVQLDETYGVIPIDPATGAFVSRGLVPSSSVSIIEEDERVGLFPEVGLETT